MKKNLYLPSIFFLFLSLTAVPQDLLTINEPMRIISYNIRYDNPNDGDNSWKNRRERVVSILGLYDADIFCLQEALINQVEYLDEAFPAFDYYGVGRDDGKKQGEFSPVFYDAMRYKLLSSGTFWLSESPDVAGSKGWYAALPRIVSWVKLQDLHTGNNFFVFNTHFDHASQHAREQSALLIRRKINRIAGKAPVILAGDFNTRESTTAYNNLVQTPGSPVLINARDTSFYSHHGPNYSFVGFDFIGVPGRIIDFIFVNPQVTVIRHAILGDNWDGIFPSDHLPVLVEIEINQ